MAFMHLFTVVAIVAATVAPTLATEFMVGDEQGWTLNFDYQAWAQGKTFYVGDKLIFKYKQGVHNVHRVNGTAFQQCATTASLSEPLTSGNDVITLATPGRKWYICGVGSHCETGKMKLVITVLPQLGSPATAPAPAPAPSTRGSNPTSAAHGIVPTTFALMVAAFAAFMVFLV